MPASFTFKEMIQMFEREEFEELTDLTVTQRINNLMIEEGVFKLISVYQALKLEYQKQVVISGSSDFIKKFKSKMIHAFKILEAQDIYFMKRNRKYNKAKVNEFYARCKITLLGHLTTGLPFSLLTECLEWQNEHYYFARKKIGSKVYLYAKNK